jgi:polysaccharide export outer membrane protein
METTTQGKPLIADIESETMRHGALLLCLTMAILLSGCALPGAYRPELLAFSPEEPYLLGPGDRLRVIVFGQDSLSNSYAVNSAGAIAMPLIGSVPVQDRDVREVGHIVAAKLRNGFVRDPHVAIEVEAYRPFFVLGEVTTGGQYPYVDRMTARTGIAIAGGFTPRGYDGEVDVTRNINGIQVTGRVPLDFPIRPGDTITVKERIF